MERLYSDELLDEMMHSGHDKTRELVKLHRDFLAAPRPERRKLKKRFGPNMWSGWIMGLCFMNAYLYVSKHQDCTYIEGVAYRDDGLGEIWEHHAWVEDSNGKVIDLNPTWESCVRREGVIRLSFNELKDIQSVPLLTVPHMPNHNRQGIELIYPGWLKEHNIALSPVQ